MKIADINLNIINRLRDYSKFSAVFVLLKSGIDAQVIYTDEEPDIILSESPQGIWLDIDENGSNDIGLQNYSFTVYSFSLQETYTFQFLLAFRYDPMNAIAGSINSDETCFPYALTEGEVINAELNWQTDLTQFLAFKGFHSGILIDSGYSENWYNSIISETIDHYLGIRFIDESGNNHYGWIRCDVLDKGRTLIIKDYAYETEPDHPIVAGDSIHYLDVASPHNLNAEIYSYENIITINLHEFLENTEVHIYDLDGKEIYSGELVNQYSQIHLTVDQGVYFIQLVSGDKKFTKKIELINLH